MTTCTASGLCSILYSISSLGSSVAQAVKPAEPRFISAFFSFPGDSSPSATTNESWINCAVAFPTYGRKARACLSRGISTGACHTRSTRRQTNRMRDKPLSGWTDISTRPWWTALLETTAHRATGGGFHPLRGSGFHPLRRAASAILRTRSIRRHGEPCAPAGAAARKPQPILTNPKGLHERRLGCSDARASHSGRRNPTTTWCATIGNRAASKGTLRIIP